MAWPYPSIFLFSSAASLIPGANLQLAARPLVLHIIGDCCTVRDCGRKWRKAMQQCQGCSLVSASCLPRRRSRGTGRVAEADGAPEQRSEGAAEDFSLSAAQFAGDQLAKASGDATGANGALATLLLASLLKSGGFVVLGGVFARVPLRFQKACRARRVEAHPSPACWKVLPHSRAPGGGVGFTRCRIDRDGSSAADEEAVEPLIRGNSECPERR